jgi:hypothetical protein
MVSITTEVEVYMDDFDDEELVAELEERGYYVSKSASDSFSVERLYDAWVYKTGNFEDIFRQFCQQNLGKSF